MKLNKDVGEKEKNTIAKQQKPANKNNRRVRERKKERKNGYLWHVELN